MSKPIDRLTIEGYRSIRKLESFELRKLNVLIGANGAGKSNFVAFFRLLRELIEQRLELAVAKLEGGADGCLHLGPQVTRQLRAGFQFHPNGYEFVLEPTPDNRLVFADETTSYVRPGLIKEQCESKPGGGPFGVKTENPEGQPIGTGNGNGSSALRLRGGFFVDRLPLS